MKKNNIVIVFMCRFGFALGIEFKNRTLKNNKRDISFISMKIMIWAVLNVAKDV